MQSTAILFVHRPIVSIAFSTLLIYGIIFLGEKLLLVLSSNKLCRLSPLQKKSLAGCLSISLISAFLYPIALHAPNSSNIFFYISLALILLGATSLAIQTRKYFLQKEFHLNSKIIGELFHRFILSGKLDFTKTCLLFLIIIYFFLTLSTPSDADSLDYHLGVPIKFLMSGFWPFSPEWFHSRLAGAGEILISLGVSVGADQFGQLLQFFGLFVIGAWIVGMKYTNYKALLLLIFFISPPLIWLVSSSKPQLLPIAFTSLAVSIAISDEDIFEGLKIIPPLLVSTAALMKFNFALSGLIVLLICIYRLYPNWSKLIQFLSASLIIYILTFIPVIAWKMQSYGGSFYENIFTLFSGDWPGYTNFYSSLQSFKDSRLEFPISLIINPFPSEWTSTLGVPAIIGILLLIRLYTSSESATLVKLLCIGIAALTIISSLFGQITARFYLEPIAWTLIAASKSNSSLKIFKNKFVISAINIQALIAITAGLCGLYSLMPGIFSVQSREQVLKNTANGYFEMSYSNHYLPESSVVLSNVRSKALSNKRIISLDWELYVDKKVDAIYPYLLKIKEEDPNYILYRGNLYDSSWYNCLSNMGSIEKLQGVTATRNFFHTIANYDFYIANFNAKKLPECYFER